MGRVMMDEGVMEMIEPISWLEDKILKRRIQKILLIILS
jgi:hypothetical protein